ncbi:MAG: tRNA-(ms[2]io[6]A)-hydroxylase [Myxococcales bacterium]|nr:tRNA-(ms[2]io[6]A)-hydroxylase [Myxococcales bacterium]
MIGEPVLRLRAETPRAWVEAVLADFDAFLQDHAANERKVVHSALTLAAQYPEHEALVEVSIEIAREELEHFAQVHALLKARGRGLGADGPDPYVGGMRRLERKGTADQLLDRLLIFSVVEARGCERFLLVAEALQDPELAALYQELARSEARHRAVYLRLCRELFGDARTTVRLEELLEAEGELVRGLPVRAALH